MNSAEQAYVEDLLARLRRAEDELILLHYSITERDERIVALEAEVLRMRGD